MWPSNLFLSQEHWQRWMKTDGNNNDIFSGLIIQLAGWEWVFYLQGGLALLWCILWILFVSDTPSSHRWVDSSQVPQPTLCQSGNLNRWTLLFETLESAHPFVDPLRNKIALAQNYHSLTDVDISHWFLISSGAFFLLQICQLLAGILLIFHL